VRGLRIWPPNAAKCCENASKFFPDALAVKERLLIKDNVPSRDNDTFLWDPDPIDIGRVIANKVANIGSRI